MKLFIYEHCPFCARARMIFGLKNLPYQQEVIMEGDVETPTRMVGRKVVPVLQKEDGSYMPESMDIVHYVDNKQAPQFASAPLDPAIEAWCKAASGPVFKLAIPRFTQADFKELSTPEARAAYHQRETNAFGDLDALMASTPALLAELEPKLAELETLLAGREGVDTNAFFLFPVLRSLSIVKGVRLGPVAAAWVASVARQSKVNLLDNQAR